MVPTCKIWYSEHNECQNHDDIYMAVRGGVILPQQQRHFENLLLQNNLICLIDIWYKHFIRDKQMVLLYSYVRKLWPVSRMFQLIIQKITVVPEHVTKCEQLRAGCKITRHKPPTMYFIPKLHKSAFIVRFIVNSSSYTTTK